MNEAYKEKDAKYERRLEDQKKKHGEQDARMKYGKNFKDFMSGREQSLRRGEVKKWDPRLKKYVSNKD